MPYLATSLADVLRSETIWKARVDRESYSAHVCSVGGIASANALLRYIHTCIHSYIHRTPYVCLLYLDMPAARAFEKRPPRARAMNRYSGDVLGLHARLTGPLRLAC